MRDVADPVTGEVMADTEALAHEYVALQEEIQAVRLKLAGLLDREAADRRTITHRLGVDGVVTGDGWTLVVTPGAPGRRTVARDVATLHRETLEAHGLGAVEYRPPTVAEVNAHRAELAAAGVPISELLVGGPAGDPRIQIVRKDH